MFIGSKLLHYERVTSTIDLCWDYAGDAIHHGMVITADEQTQGRGQRGRHWHAPAGSALLMSILLKMDVQQIKPYLLSIWAALGLCRYLTEELELQPKLKWPNDVQLDGKKVAGILVEQRRDWITVGMGINLTISREEFDSAGLTDAASLSHYTQVDLSQKAVLSKLLTYLNISFLSLATTKPGTWHEQWLHFAQIRGANVKLVAKNAIHYGCFKDIDETAAVLATAEGLLRFQPEEVASIVVLN